MATGNLRRGNKCCVFGRISALTRRTNGGVFFEKMPRFGSDVTVTLSRHGDLFSPTYLPVHLALLPGLRKLLLFSNLPSDRDRIRAYVGYLAESHGLPAVVAQVVSRYTGRQSFYDRCAEHTLLMLQCVGCNATTLRQVLSLGEGVLLEAWYAPGKAIVVLRFANPSTNRTLNLKSGEWLLAGSDIPSPTLANSTLWDHKTHNLRAGSVYYHLRAPLSMLMGDPHKVTFQHETREAQATEPLSV